MYRLVSIVSIVKPATMEKHCVSIRGCKGFWGMEEAGPG